MSGNCGAGGSDKCPNTQAPKCCEPPKKPCPPPPPKCDKLPDTLTFTCPQDCAPKQKEFCPEKKKDECVCLGAAATCGKKEEKKDKC